MTQTDVINILRLGKNLKQDKFLLAILWLIIKRSVTRQAMNPLKK